MFGHHTHERSTHRYRKDPDRVAGGYKAALSNPNTTSEGRRHAKAELRAMGRGREAHVGIWGRLRRVLGIHKTPRRERVREEHLREQRRRRHDY